jgi:hypothetical protein
MGLSDLNAAAENFYLAVQSIRFLQLASKRRRICHRTLGDQTSDIAAAMARSV